MNSSSEISSFGFYQSSKVTKTTIGMSLCIYECCLMDRF